MIYGGRKLNRVKKRAHIVIALCLVLVLCACGASKLEKQLDLGAKYLEELDYDNAIAAYTAAIEVDPANIDAYVGLAKAYEEKSLSLENTYDSLDTLLLGYATINNMLTDSKTEYAGIDESTDSAIELRTEIEASFVNQYFNTLKDLNTNDLQDEISALQERYGEYINEFLDVQEPKSIDEISIDEEAKQNYESFVKGENSFVYEKGLYGNDSYYSLDEVLGDNSSYTLNDIIDAYNSMNSITVGDVRNSYIDCGKDGIYELLLEIDYTYEDEYARTYYTTFMVIKNDGGALKLSYIDQGSELHFLSEYEEYEEVWHYPMKIYYNGLVYHFEEFGSDITGYRYTAGYIDAKGKYNAWYDFQEQFNEEYGDFSENKITFHDGEDSENYYYLTRGYTNLQSGEYKSIRQVDDVVIDSSAENSEMFLTVSAMLEFDHNSVVTPANFKFNTFEEIVEMIEAKRQEIGLTDSIYFK